MEVQVFGVRKSAATRAALRFFAERRVKAHFVDLDERAASPGELRRFGQRFGALALVDRASRRFGDLGLAHARLSDERWIEKLAAEPLLLRMPLVRWQQRVTVGAAEAEWKAWVEAERAATRPPSGSGPS
jgi:arsenate reductase-like glutaredoxin family protein